MSDAETKWYFKTSTWIIGYLIIGPFILPLVWFNPRYSPAQKCVLTLMILIITAVLLQIMKFSLDSIYKSYELLQGK